MDIHDLTGQIFGKWTCLYRATNGRRQAQWICKCECGELGVVRACHLLNGSSTRCFQCGNSARAIKQDLTGKLFGSWTVIRRLTTKKGHLHWLCKCSCGKEQEVSGNSLVYGLSSRCRSCRSCRGRSVYNINIGDRFGRYAVVGNAGKDRIGRELLSVRCDCGSESVVRAANLVKSYSRGCRKCALKESRSHQKQHTNSAERSVYTNYVRGSIDRGYFWGLSEAEFGIIIRQSCHYCGSSPSRVREIRGHLIQFNGVDRKNNHQGYTPDNVVPCCTLCNRAKNDMPYAEFLFWISQMVAFRYRDSQSTESTVLPCIAAESPYTKQEGNGFVV